MTATQTTQRPDLPTMLKRLSFEDRLRVEGIVIGLDMKRQSAQQSATTATTGATK